MNFFGDALLREGLWGQVSARCNSVGRGGHCALDGTHVRPETKKPPRKSQITPWGTFWGVYVMLETGLRRRLFGGICTICLCS